MTRPSLQSRTRRLRRSSEQTPVDHESATDGRPKTSVRTRALVHSFSSGVASKLFSAAFGLVAFGLAVRQLGENDFGVVATLVGVMSIFGFLDLGVGSVTMNLAAAAHARGEALALREIVTRSIKTLSMVGVTVSVVAAVVILLLPDAAILHTATYSTADVRLAMILVVAAIGLGIPAGLGMRIAFAVQRGYVTSIANVVGSAITLAMVLAAPGLSLSLVYYVIAFAWVSPLVNAIYSLRMVSSRTSPVRWVQMGFSLQDMALLIAPAWPFILMSAAVALAYQTDLLVVAYAVGPAAATGYSLLVKVYSSANSLFATGQQQFWASTSHALAVHDYPWVRRTFFVALAGLTGVYAAGAALFTVIAPPFLEIWAGPSVNVGLSLLVLFAVWNVYSTLMTQLSFLLNAANVIRLQAVLALSMAAVNLPLGIWISGFAGSAGPLIASLVAHASIILVPTLVMVRRVLRSMLRETVDA